MHINSILESVLMVGFSIICGHGGVLKGAGSFSRNGSHEYLVLTSI